MHFATTKYNSMFDEIHWNDIKVTPIEATRFYILTDIDGFYIENEGLYINFHDLFVMSCGLIQYKDAVLTVLEFPLWR